MSATSSSAGKRGRGAPPCVSGPPPPSVPAPIQSPEGPAPVGSPTQSQGDSLAAELSSGSYDSATGSTIGIQDGQYEVHIYAGSLMPCNNVSNTITTIMLDHMEVGACTFEMISPERLLNYWERFQTKCRWDPALTDEVYQLWHQISDVQYKNMLSNWKKKWNEEEKMSCWNTAVWQALVDYWNRQDARQKGPLSEPIKNKKKKGRLSEPAGSGRTCVTRHRARRNPDGHYTHKEIKNVIRGNQLSNTRCMSGSVSTSSSGFESSRLYTEVEVEHLLAQEREILSEVADEKVSMWRNEATLLLAKNVRELREKSQRKIEEYFAQRCAKMQEQFRRCAEMQEQFRRCAEMQEQFRRWQQGMQGPGPDAPGDLSGSQGRGSGSS